MDKNSLIIGGIILLIVILGGVFLVSRNQTGTTQQPNIVSKPSPSGVTQTSPSSTSASPLSSEQGSQNTVEYTPGGFVPKTITVKVGTTVTWVNKDNDPVWVASNPHPVHTNLPGFDAKKGVPTGGTYSYTFTKLGSWGYHNHLEPSNTGTVVVE